MTIMPSSQRHWFPVIVAGLTVLLALVVYASRQQFDFSTVTSVFSKHEAVEAPPAVTEADYQSAVTSIMSTYRTDKNAQAAYDALVVLHVPASMQQFHIDVIIAFGKLAGKNAADGQARLNALAAQYSWFVL
jgi:predicted anti-sigma-YlaC factor YlaD